MAPQMASEFPRAYGLQICKKCKELFTANTYFFPNLINKRGEERANPTCTKCTKEPTKKDEEMEAFISTIFNFK